MPLLVAGWLLLGVLESSASVRRRPRRFRRVVRWLALGVGSLVALAVLAVATLGTGTVRDAAQDTWGWLERDEVRPSRCPDLVPPQETRRVQHARGGLRGALVPVGGRGERISSQPLIRMPLGTNRDPQIRRQAFELPPGVRVGQVAAGPIGDLSIADGGGAAPIGQNQLTYRAVSSRASSRIVTIIVCYDAGGPTRVRGGRYQGALAVGARQRAVAGLPIEVTVRDNRYWRPIAAALVGLLAGLAVRLIAERRQRGAPGTAMAGSEEEDHTSVPVLNARFLITAGSGLAAAVYAYTTIYANEPVFDATFSNVWRITVETFTGTLAGKAVTDLARISGPARPKPTA